MKYFVALVVGFVIGGTAAYLYPKETHQVHQTVTQKADAVGKALSK